MHCKKTVATLEHQFEKHSKISDEELDSVVSQVTRCNPKCGEKSVTGRLKSVGILVSAAGTSERILATSRSKWWCVTLCNSPSPSSLRRSFTKCLVAYRRIP